MQIQSEFSKMQCLFKGNRFSGFNIAKTKVLLNYQMASDSKVDFIVTFLSDISYLEVDDEVKYQQWATIRLTRKDFIQPILFTIAKQLKQELIRRYETSNIYKFLELKQDEDVFKDSDLSHMLNKLLADFNNHVR